MKMNVNAKVVNILSRELSYADFALTTLNREMKIFEKKYNMDSQDFMDKFEKGKLGDARVWFTWYGLALSAKDWDETKKEIAKTIRPS